MAERVGLPDPTPSELANVVYGLERLVMREWRKLPNPNPSLPHDGSDLRRAKVAVMALVYQLRQDSDAARLLGIIQ